MDTSTQAPLTNGAFVFWDVKPASHTALLAALERINIGSYCPPPLSVADSLKRAMMEYAKGQGTNGHTRQTPEGQKMKRDKMVQRHASAEKHGFEVVDVERGEENNYYSPTFAAKIEHQNGSGEVVVVTSGYADNYQIQAAYEANRKIVSAGGVGKFLVRMISELHGTCVRSMGGTYYVPGEFHERWVKVVNAVEAVSDTKITCAEIKINKSTIRTIKAAIQKEIQDEAAKLEEIIAAGEQGVTGMENKIQKGRQLLAKTQEYEQVVGEELTALRNLLARVEQSACAAIAKKQAEEQFDDLLTV